MFSVFDLRVLHIVLRDCIGNESSEGAVDAGGAREFRKTAGARRFVPQPFRNPEFRARRRVS